MHADYSYSQVPFLYSRYLDNAGHAGCWRKRWRRGNVMSDARAPRHILVLSDDEDVRLVIHDLLEEEGYRVTDRPYLSGDTETTLRATPDAILIDCNRMELDASVEFLRIVRSEPHLREIPIIASVSAVKILDDYQHEVNALGLRVLRKPFDIERLAEVIAECFAERPSQAVIPQPLS